MKPRLIVLTVLCVMLAAAQSSTVALASPRATWPGEGYYGECDWNGPGTYRVFYDFEQIDNPYPLAVASGFGEFTQDVGFQTTAVWGTWNLHLYAYLPGSLLLTDAWFYASEPVAGYGYTGYIYVINGSNEWTSGYPSVEDGRNYLTPTEEIANTATYITDLDAGHGADSDYQMTVTGFYAQGNYTGECPIDDYPVIPIELSADHYRPLHSDVTYEVNHVDGYGPMLDDIFTEIDAPVYNSVAGQVVAISNVGTGYLVKVVADDDSYSFYSNLVTVNPKLNDTIPAGCVIGTTGEQIKSPSETYTQTPGMLWYFPGTDFYNAETNVYIDWQTEYTEPPQTAIPCGAELRTPNCLDYNPALSEHASGWNTLYVDEYNIDTDQVKLNQYLSSISQVVILDHEASYYVTLSTKQYHAYDWLSVIVLQATTGTVIDTETIVLDVGDTLGESTVSQVGPIDLSNWDSNDAYTIAVVLTNPNSFDGVWIDDVCVHTGNAVLGTSYCYFNNFQLDTSSQWDSSVTADWSANPDTFGTGVVLGPGDWISQPVDLAAYSDDDAVYTLTVTGKITGNDLGDLVDIFTTGWEGDISQQVMNGETVTLDIGDVTINNALISLQKLTEFTVVETTTLSGDFVIEADVGNTKDIYIDWVCIEPKTGVWPGSEDDDIADGTSSCDLDVCAMPTSLLTTNLAAWIVYLWCQLQHFFNCTLAAWIAAIASWLRQLRDLIGLFGRYIAVLVGYLASWLLSMIIAFGVALGDLISWILSELWNRIMALGVFQLLWDALGYLALGAVALIDLAQVIGAWLISFFRAFITFAELIRLFMASISTALSGGVETITLPSCAAPSSPLYDGMCLVWTLAQGVFDEFPAFSIGMLLDSALICFVTVIWTMRTLGGAMGNV